MKYANWELDTDYLTEEFNALLAKYGKIKIYTKLDHCSSSSITRYISAYYLDTDDKGLPFMRCIARERKVVGCGMDMGFDLAYRLFNSVFYGTEKKYQDCLVHNWI